MRYMLQHNRMLGCKAKTDSTLRGANRFASLRRAIRIIEVRDDSRCAHDAEIYGNDRKRCQGIWENACVNYFPLFGQPHSHHHCLLGQWLKR